MRRRQRSSTGGLVVVLLLLSSALTMLQLGIISQSFGQFGSQTWTRTGPPGFFTTGMYSRNPTWTQTGLSRRGNQSWTWSHTGSQSWTRIGNRTWTWVHTANQTYSGNQTTRTQTGPLPTNQTRMERRGAPPGLMSGWAHSNVTVGARNITQPFFMNGTDRVRLSHIAINASSAGQIIRNIAFNQTVAQIEFDRNGSIQLIINSSVKPTQVFADNIELSEAQSLNGLTPTSEMWFYDQNNQTLVIFADPSSITIFYGPIVSPIPEFPTAPALVLIISLTAGAIVTNRRRLHSLEHEGLEKRLSSKNHMPK